MVERVNRTIKDSTIKINNYENLEQMETNLYAFLLTYNSNRRHLG